MKTVGITSQWSWSTLLQTTMKPIVFNVAKSVSFNSRIPIELESVIKIKNMPTKFPQKHMVGMGEFNPISFSFLREFYAYRSC